VSIGISSVGLVIVVVAFGFFIVALWRKELGNKLNGSKKLSHSNFIQISFRFYSFTNFVSKTTIFVAVYLIKMLLLGLVCFFDQLINVSRTSSARNFYSSRSHFAFLECRCLRNAGDLHIFRQLLILSYFLKIVEVIRRFLRYIKINGF
jgi:hypothetical protein